MARRDNIRWIDNNRKVKFQCENEWKEEKRANEKEVKDEEETMALLNGLASAKWTKE